jgi:hypothetical protein
MKISTAQVSFTAETQRAPREILSLRPQRLERVLLGGRVGGERAILA